MYSYTVLMAKNMQSRYWKSCFLFKASEVESVPCCPPQLMVTDTDPCRSLASKLLFSNPVAMSKLPSNYKYFSHWIQGHLIQYDLNFT